MLKRSGPASAVRRRRVAVAAWAAVFVPLGALAILVNVLWLRFVIAVFAVLGAVAVAILTTREQSAEAREEEEAAARERAERLRVPIRPLGQVSPYEVGVDPEEISVGDGSHSAPYVPRERDEQLRQTLTQARERSEPSLIVVSGPSKAGKSRTLFAAASAVLSDAVLIAPHNAASLSDLLKPGGLPTLEPGPVVLWLDDLEDFVRIGEGMDPPACSSASGPGTGRS